MTARPIDTVRQRLEACGIAAQRLSRGLSARCPVPEHGKGEGDRNPSLAVYEQADGGVCLKCWAGCTQKRICEVLSLAVSDLHPGAVVDGCTLESYAEAKRLPVEFLRSLELRTRRYQGKPAVAIPHFDEAGVEVATLFRLAVSPRLLRWEKGNRAIPYGLWRLADARAAGRVTVVEGPSDCQVLWFHGEPALGIPGAGSPPEEWAHWLDGITDVYLVMEPDGAGERLVERVASSPLCHRVRLVRLDGVKDPAALHARDPRAFPSGWRGALERAPRLADAMRELRNSHLSRAREQCADLLQCPDILAEFSNDLRAAGVVGEEKLARILYLALTSRVFQRPVSVVICGPSSAGKSYVVERTVGFFPPSSCLVYTTMSDHALVFGERPLSHKFVVLYEAAGQGGRILQYLIRSLLSEGCIRYAVVERAPSGKYVTREIYRPGPTGLLLTTTAVRIHPETETRILSVTADDSREQTKRVMEQLARDDADVEGVDFARWHALQELLEGSGLRVVVPFTRELAVRIEPESLRLRRDFSTLLSLVKAHALLHQATRSRDARGRVVATLDDYEAVRVLVEDLIGEAVKSSVPKKIRETVDAVSALAREDGVSVSAVAKMLQLDESSASRRVRKAIDAGYLLNEEERKGRPARLKPAAPLPEDRHVLPKRSELEAQIWGPPVGPARQEKGPLPDQMPQRPCYACGGTHFWINAAGGPVCGSCRPPAGLEFPRWVEAPQGEGVIAHAQ